jgi:hypothetical protein
MRTGTATRLGTGARLASQRGRGRDNNKPYSSPTGNSVSGYVSCVVGATSPLKTSPKSSTALRRRLADWRMVMMAVPLRSRLQMTLGVALSIGT